MTKRQSVKYHPDHINDYTKKPDTLAPKREPFNVVNPTLQQKMKAYPEAILEVIQRCL